MVSYRMSRLVEEDGLDTLDVAATAGGTWTDAHRQPGCTITYQQDDPHWIPHG